MRQGADRGQGQCHQANLQINVIKVKCSLTQNLKKLCPNKTWQK